MKSVNKLLLILLVLFNLLLILYFVVFSYQGYLEGAPAWILYVLASPLSFLLFPFYRFFPELFQMRIFEYFLISLLFQLQYQSIVYFIFKVKLKIKLEKLLILFLIFIIIVLSACKMREIILPSSFDEMRKSEHLKSMLIGKSHLQITTK